MTRGFFSLLSILQTLRSVSMGSLFDFLSFLEVTLAVATKGNFSCYTAFLVCLAPHLLGTIATPWWIGSTFWSLAFCYVLCNFHWVQQYVAICWCTFRFHTIILNQTNRCDPANQNGRKIPRWPFSRMWMVVLTMCVGEAIQACHLSDG